MRYEKELRVNSDYDVIVAGGGPAGCTAAAAAAREGARTLLIEATGALGGMGTMGLIPAWCPFGDGEKIIYRGLAERVLRESNKGTYLVDPEAWNWAPINPENLKRVYDDLVTEFGVNVLFNTQVVDVQSSTAGTAGSLVLANKAGLSAVTAGVYVDCTGDADVAARAGAEIMKGDENSDLQMATHCFEFGNVDLEARNRAAYLHPHNPDSPIYGIAASGAYPLITDKHACNNVVGPATVGFNAGHIRDVDNTDPVSVSRALMQGRKMAAEFLRALSAAQPEVFGSAFIAQTAPLMGIRETRRVIGDYLLTIDAYRERRSFDDEIGRSCYYIDVHGKKPGSEKHPRLEKGESYGIPYRCLTPKGLTNVLTAGRCISSDRPINGSVRVMPVCLVTGEAAGLAAALAVKHNNNDVHAVDTDKLRTRLKEEGGYLPDAQKEIVPA